jgi:phosphorylcholine metabolism protein LicD
MMTIIKGVVKIMVPNKDIKDFYQKQKDYQKLIKWEQEQWIPKAKIEQEQYNITNQKVYG